MGKQISGQKGGKFCRSLVCSPAMLFSPGVACVYLEHEVMVSESQEMKKLEKALSHEGAGNVQIITEHLVQAKCTSNLQHVMQGLFL